MVGAFRVEKTMASLTLKNIKKVYPFNGDDAKKKKKGEPAKKTNLQVTASTCGKHSLISRRVFAICPGNHCTVCLIESAILCYSALFISN